MMTDLPLLMLSSLGKDIINVVKGILGAHLEAQARQGAFSEALALEPRRLPKYILLRER